MGPKDFVVTDKGRDYFSILVDKRVSVPDQLSNLQIDDYIVLLMIDRYDDVSVREWNTSAKSIVRRLFEAGYIDYA